MNKYDKNFPTSIGAMGLKCLEIAWKSDPEYLQGWHDNIAVCMQDEGCDYESSQHAASRFLSLLGADTSEYAKSLIERVAIK